MVQSKSIQFHQFKRNKPGVIASALIQALSKLRQKDLKLGASLAYPVKTCLQNQIKKYINLIFGKFKRKIMVSNDTCN